MLIPSSRPRQTRIETMRQVDSVIASCVGESASYNTEVWPEVFVLARRGYYRDTMGVRGKNDRAIYDDAFFVVSPTVYRPFNGNVDPSPKHRKHVASVIAPQVLWFIPGTHWGKIPHKAFRQYSKFHVMRDDEGKDFGMFGINNHRGGRTGTSSLGCLTVPPAQWDEYRDLINAQLKLYAQKTFPMFLLDMTNG